MLEGNRAHRPVPKEVPPEPGDCSPPDHLPDAVKAFWTALAPELEAKGLLAPRYLPSFEVLCCAFVEWRKAADLLARTGPLVQGRSRSGQAEVVSNPAAREFVRFGNVVRNAANDFGMTPAALTAIARATEQQTGQSPARLLG